MKIAVLLCALWAILLSVTADESLDGYIFTSPRTLNWGAENELHFQRFGKTPAGKLKVQVFYKEKYNSDNETVAGYKNFKIPSGQTYSVLNLSLKQNKNYVYNGRIQINGTFGNKKISGSDTVSFSSPNKDIIIVQTDKPFYKPGESVQFRILKIDAELKPTSDDAIANAYIQDPAGNRVAQYNNINLSEGIVQRQFLLANEPELGSWSILASTNTTTQTAYFEVKEYILPKFDVTIKFPPFVLANAESVPIDICATYTYGEPVVGTLHLNASVINYFYDSNKYPTLQETENIDGCYTYTLNVSLIEPGNDYSYRSIQIVANVVEEGTGVERTTTQTLDRQTTPLILNFFDQRDFYKLGLPYSGNLQVSNPDGTPTPNEQIEICATINKQRILAQWSASKTLQYCKNYTSDAKGVIKYTLISTNIDEISINLIAKSTRYHDHDNTSGTQTRKNILNQPQASAYLTPFYSPSSSFIQLQPVHQPVPCDTKQSFKLLYSAKDNEDYQFYYQVVRQSEVVIDSSIQVKFSAEDDVSDQYDNEDYLDYGDGKQISPPPESFSETEDVKQDCPAAIDSKFSTPIGEVSIDVEIDPSLSSTFYLLVYYLKDNRETVADSQKIEVEKCFRNKVDFAFGDKELQPSLETSIQISASPNSMCGIKAIDKSVSLLDSSDQLTIDSVFQSLQSLDTNDYYKNNPCSSHAVQPGLENSKFIIRPLPGFYPSSSYDDSLTAFQLSGFLVISNLIVFSRPCNTNNNFYGPVGGPLPIFDSFRGGRAGGFISTPAFGPDGGRSTIPTSSVKGTRDFFPATWLFKMKNVGPTGLYIGEETLPDTITQWIGSAVCINSEQGLGISNTTSITAFQAFFIDYTLPASVIRGEQVVVVVSISNYADGALPITVGLVNSDGFVPGNSIDGDYCLKPNSTLTLPIILTATKVGDVNITVRAETDQSSNVCGNSPLSKSYARDAITKQLLVEAEGFPQNDVQNFLFCPSDEKNHIYDKKISLTAPRDIVPDSSRAYTDFTGNVLGKAINNLNNLVDLPTGCGEQNMVKFTPNYIVLDYLKSIGMLTDDIKNQALSNLRRGYQQELNYRHYDGSFSAFGNVDKQGSIFLTSFVLRSFYQAKRYIYIDDDVVKRMQEWIVSNQLPDGSFPNIGPLLDLGLEGGIGKEKSHGSITAYVVTSLLLSDYKNKTKTASALTYLDQNPPTNPYATVLYAYAQAVAGNKIQAQKLLKEARQRLDSKGGMESFIIVNGTKAISIEADGYAVLATLKAGGTPADVLSYVRYLTSNLNQNGGFQSTQDTCVGLEALAQFAAPVYKQKLNIKVTTSGALKQTVKLTDSNKLLVQRFKVSSVQSIIDVEATGTGCGLLQTSVRYNTKTAPETRKFSLEVDGDCLDHNCTKAKINVLTSYIPSERKSGMSILQIKLISGFVPDRDSLDAVKSDSKNNVLRVDVQNNNVIFYLSEISNAVDIITFQIQRIVEVIHPQPGQAKVYDYYANENSSSTSYKLRGLA